MRNGWRVMASSDGDNFMRDEIKLYIAYRDDDGIRAVKPIVLELDDGASDSTATSDLPPSVIPMELAEAIFEALGYQLLGISEPYNEIARLKRELKQERERVDKLISGIGRLGGVNDPESERD